MRCKCRYSNAPALGALATLAISMVMMGGCASTPEQRTHLDKPITQMMTVDIQGHQVVGIRLLQTNGVSFCGAYRADHGLIVCSHFDLQGLKKAGIAAAMAMHWKTNGLKGELDAKIEKVNALAAAKGISVGMTVREALGHLIDPSAPATEPTTKGNATATEYHAG